MLFPFHQTPQECACHRLQPEAGWLQTLGNAAARLQALNTELDGDSAAEPDDRAAQQLTWMWEASKTAPALRRLHTAVAS